MRFRSWLWVSIITGACAGTAAEAPAIFEENPRAVAAGRDPSLAVRASSAISLIAVENGDLWYLTSYDGGDTFEERVKVNGATGAVASHGENSPRLYLRSRSELYCMWQSRDADSGGSALQFARSMNWGETFTQPIAVDGSEDSSKAFATMNVSPQGRVYVAWLDGRDRGRGPAGTSSVYIARSIDRGVSFEPGVRVATGVCPCCRPTIGFGPQDVMYVSWRGVEGDNIRDIQIARSSDGGLVWSEPVRVAEDNWKINGCPHSGAALASMGGRLFVSWYTIREGQSNLYYAWSDDGAATFSARRNLADGILDANHPYLLAAGGAIHAVFQGRDPQEQRGWGKIGVYYRQIDRECELSPAVRISGTDAGASYPTLAFEQPGRIFAAWTQPGGEEGPRVILSRGRLARTLDVGGSHAH